MTEAEFVSAIVEESGCFFHLDVNNVYVNSQNFNFDPITYLASLPLEKVGYLHVAGHYVEEDGLIIDTHGAKVIDPVWALLEQTYAMNRFDAANTPTCLERDFNIPALSELLLEVDKIREIQMAFSNTESKRKVQTHA